MAIARKSRKSQAAVEFLIILAVVLMIAVTLGTMNVSTLGEQRNTERVMKAQDAVNEVHKAAELVYYEGDGAMTKVFISIPDGVKTILLRDGLIEMNLTMNSEVRTVTRKHTFDIQGTFPAEKGYYWLIVESKGDHVLLSY